MKKTIVGLVGETGSGKDTVAEYLRDNFGAKLMRFSDPLKDTLSIYFDKLSKDDQAWLYDVFQERFGADVLSKAIQKRVEDIDAELVIINGLRMPSDYEFMQRFPDSKILYTTAPSELRWKRVATRGEKTDDDISFEKFQELDRRSTEVHIPEIGSKSDWRIDNTQDLEYLLAEADKIMKEVGIEKK